MNSQGINNINQWLREELFQQVPFNIAVIDKDFNIIEANENFVEYFGDWQHKKCYEAYKGRFTPCENCMSFKTFEDGRVRVTDEVGIDRHGRTSHYVGHIVPIKDENGDIPYVIEMTTDVTETKRWQREYSILFERAPCYIAVVDQNFRITRTNELFRNTFGESKGKFCYEVYKHRKTKCKDCPAVKTLQDGQVHSSTQIGLTKEDNKAQYVITTSPLSRGEGKVSHIIEMAVDVTEIRKLEKELAKSNILREALVNNSPFGIIAMNKDDKATIVNPSAEELFKLDKNVDIVSLNFRDMLPDDFFKLTRKTSKRELNDTTIRDLEGDIIPVNLTSILLKQANEVIGKAAFIQNLSQIKQLERDKIDAERLAAVGQTVAGLAHSVKNILMGLEGGMYMVRSGLDKGNSTRITEGWEVLERYFEKTTTMVKDFLSFSKGRLPEVKEVNPNDLALAMIDLYGDTAKKLGIILKADLGKRVKPALLDPDGIHTCLTNLISNAIDACQMSDKKNCEVLIKTRENNGTLVFEVIDSGCGIDYETKQKVFTSFFTTKGGEGTGLGLLTTRKIVYEHGGKIVMESNEGKGTNFRMEFPRDRLSMLADNSN